MRITKRQLKRIIREEYSKIKRQQRLSESRRRRRLYENAAPPAIQAVQMAMDGASQMSIQSALEGMGLSPADAMAEANFATEYAMGDIDINELSYSIGYSVAEIQRYLR